MIDNMVEFSLNVKTLLEHETVPGTNDLGIQDVFYGDQNRLPRTPAVCVEPGEKRRKLEGLPRRALTTMICYVLVYHNPVTSREVAQEEKDNLTEAIEDKLHADAQMGGTVIDSMVLTTEYGYAQRNNTLFRVSRLAFEATSKVNLPSSA
jgi:hypothetical protein